MRVDCLSCDANNQSKAHCEQCGAAMPRATVAPADALSLLLAVVCRGCDGYNEPGTSTCELCGQALSGDSGRHLLFEGETTATTNTISARDRSSELQLAPPALLPRIATNGDILRAPPPVTMATPQPKVAKAMDKQLELPPPAAATACRQCQSLLVSGDKFCRMCGARQDGTSAPASPTQRPSQPPPQGPATQMFGAVQLDVSARLMLVRGDPAAGSQWRIAGETVVGRTEGGVCFSHDQHIAKRHARLFFQGTELWVDPLQTTNGVFVRMREPAKLRAGDEFTVGAQRLRIMTDQDRPLGHPLGSDGTTVFGSPVKTGPAIALLRLGGLATHHELIWRQQRLLTVGRAFCDVNFPLDGFVSERHLQLSHQGDADGSLLLEDLHSRNGTYVRIQKPTKLVHGDLLLMGEQVLRVELLQ